MNTHTLKSQFNSLTSNRQLVVAHYANTLTLTPVRKAKVVVSSENKKLIRKLYRKGARQVVLAARFGITQAEVSRIVTGINK